MMSAEPIEEAPLAASRVRPARFYWIYPYQSQLTDYVLIVREWFATGDDEEPPAVSVYAVQLLPHYEHGRGGFVYLFMRANPLPSGVKLYDDAEAEDRVFSCYVPITGDHKTPDYCDCKGYRTFARCTHLDALADANRLAISAQISEATETPDTELEAWLLGEDKSYVNGQ